MDRTHDSHGLIRLEDQDCWRFLTRHSIGRVALVWFGSPEVFPVNYVVDDTSVVFRTGPGTKLARAEDGAEAAFEVDDAYEVLETGASVIIHGVLRAVTAPEERARLEKLGLRSWAPGNVDHFVRVMAQRVTGRRIPVHTFADGLGTDAG